MEQLAADLRRWCSEYAGISGQEVSIPNGLCKFLASRLVESGIGEPDPRVVTAHICGEHRKVKITGVRGSMLHYEYVDGSIGSGLIPASDVSSHERSRALMELEKQGVIK